MDEGKQTDREDDRFKRWRRPSRTSAFWIFFVLVLIFAAKFFNSTPSDAPTISYIDYREYLENGQIAEAIVVGENEFHGTLNNGERFVVNLGPIDAETKRVRGC